MKVLIITNQGLGNSATLPEKRLIKGLAAKGADITILAQGKATESPDTELAGIKILYQRITGKFDIASIRRIRSLIRDKKYDILHFMSGKAISNGLIAARGIDVKTIGYLGSLSC